MSNYSFEQFKVCPGNYFQGPSEFKVPDWKPAGLGTPDHFHYCSKGEASVPYNWAGVSAAYEGDGYAGLYLWMDDATDYREYLQCRLINSLVKDSTYLIEFHYKLSSYSNYSIDRIGLHLTDSGGFQHDKVINVEPTFSIIQDSALTKTTGFWELGKFEYKAKGNEKFLIIGNFYNNADTKNYRIRSRPVSEPMLSHAAYYYIDYVVVIPKFVMDKPQAQVNTEFIAEEVSLNKNYVLKNIHFEFNSFTLLPNSFDELNGIVNFLDKNPKVNIEVSGHTDDVGSEAYNGELSEKRTKSVAQYLIAKGIGGSRITTFGYGKKQPLVPGTTEEARKLNRRVEVKFLE